jgi:hypothetical protein
MYILDRNKSARIWLLHHRPFCFVLLYQVKSTEQDRFVNNKATTLCLLGMLFYDDVI